MKKHQVIAHLKGCIHDLLEHRQVKEAREFAQDAAQFCRDLGWSGAAGLFAACVASLTGEEIQ